MDSPAFVVGVSPFTCGLFGQWEKRPRKVMQLFKWQFVRPRVINTCCLFDELHAMGVVSFILLSCIEACSCWPQVHCSGRKSPWYVEVTHATSSSFKKQWKSSSSTQIFMADMSSPALLHDVPSTAPPMMSMLQLYLPATGDHSASCLFHSLVSNISVVTAWQLMAALLSCIP